MISDISYNNYKKYVKPYMLYIPKLNKFINIIYYVYVYIYIYIYMYIYIYINIIKPFTAIN